MARCPWARTDLSIAYHDSEWGVPAHDESTLFEFLVLEGAQAGLSWETILNKRERYREVFHGFDPVRVGQMTGRDVERLLKDPGIVRNRGKVTSAIDNARVVLDIRREFGSLDEYLWSFVGGTPIVNEWTTLGQIPAQTLESLAMSKALKARGMRFVGPTICYAFMQAVGMVNDHLVSCPRRSAITWARA